MVMAAGQFVLNNVLCFLTAKFGNTANKYLKSAVLDFYDADELYVAKGLLLKEVNDMRKDINLPHIPDRREGENRAVRIVDDIFTILIHLDENLKLRSIAKYVSDGPDTMPSTRLYDGDLGTIMKRLDKVESYVAELSSKLAAILTSIQADQTQTLTVKPAGAASAPADRDFTAGYSKSVSGNQSSATDWATIASTPYSHGNRFAALATDDADDDSTGAQPFTVIQRRRSAKRARQRSSPVTVQPLPPQQQQRAPRRAPTLIGKATNVSGSNLTAAAKIRKKAVFCLDNINVNCSEDDIRSYVSNLFIPVISCFEVHTRRRRDDTVASVADRKAFRLCIYDDDRDKLLKVNAWPESVTVSQWYFKGTNANSTDKRPRSSISGGDVDATARHSVSVKASHKDNVDDVSGAAAAVAVVAAATSVPPANTDQADNAASVLQDVSMMSNDDTILAACDINNGN